MIKFGWLAHVGTGRHRFKQASIPGLLNNENGSEANIAGQGHRPSPEHRTASVTRGPNLGSKSRTFGKTELPNQGATFSADMPRHGACLSVLVASPREDLPESRHHLLPVYQQLGPPWSPPQALLADSALLPEICEDTAKSLQKSPKVTKKY